MHSTAANGQVCLHAGINTSHNLMLSHEYLSFILELVFARVPL